MPPRNRGLVAWVLVAWGIVVVWAGWLYSSERVYAREYFTRLAASPALPVYTPGDIVTWKDEQKALFYRWQVAEPKFRWTEGTNSALLFRLAPGWNRDAGYVLRMHFAGAINAQHVTIVLNKTVVANVVLRGPGAVEATIPGNLLHDADIVDLLLPDAARPSRKDLRVLAIAFVDFVLQPVPKPA